MRIFHQSWFQSFLDKPVAPKKEKQQEAQKLKKVITKTMNKAIEEDIRAKALDGKKTLLSKKKTPTKAAAAKKAKK